MAYWLDERLLAEGLPAQCTEAWDETGSFGTAPAHPSWLSGNVTPKS